MGGGYKIGVCLAEKKKAVRDRGRVPCRGKEGAEGVDAIIRQIRVRGEKGEPLLKTVAVEILCRSGLCRSEARRIITAQTGNLWRQEKLRGGKGKGTPIGLVLVPEAAQRDQVQEIVDLWRTTFSLRLDATAVKEQIKNLRSWEAEWQNRRDARLYQDRSNRKEAGESKPQFAPPSRRQTVTGTVLSPGLGYRKEIGKEGKREIVRRLA